MAIYPTWQRFTKMWKTIIFPIIKKNINVYSWDQPSNDEEYEITTKDIIDDAKLDNIINQIQEDLISRGYDVTNWAGKEDSDLTVNGKDTYAPQIDITLFTSELDDDEILYSWDDSRFAENWNDPRDDFGFNLSYSKWIKDHNIKDTYDNILKAPKKVQRSYCDWVRSTDYTRLWIRIDYVE